MILLQWYQIRQTLPKCTSVESEDNLTVQDDHLTQLPSNDSLTEIHASEDMQDRVSEDVSDEKASHTVGLVGPPRTR